VLQQVAGGIVVLQRVVTEGIINTRKGEGCKGGNYKYKEGKGL
jgi:hypothetical protein